MPTVAKLTQAKVMILVNQFGDFNEVLNFEIKSAATKNKRFKATNKKMIELYDQLCATCCE